MSFKITGLDQLQRELDQAGKAFEALDGEIATLSFDPSDQTSVERAIADMELAIDSKISSHRGNAIVESVSAQLKERYQIEILDRAAAAKMNSDETKMNDSEIDQGIFRQIREHGERLTPRRIQHL